MLISKMQHEILQANPRTPWLGMDQSASAQKLSGTRVAFSLQVKSFELLFPKQGVRGFACRICLKNVLHFAYHDQ